MRNVDVRPFLTAFEQMGYEAVNHEVTLGEVIAEHLPRLFWEQTELVQGYAHDDQVLRNLAEFLTDLKLLVKSENPPPPPPEDSFVLVGRTFDRIMTDGMNLIYATADGQHIVVLPHQLLLERNAQTKGLMLVIGDMSIDAFNRLKRNLDAYYA